MRVTALVVRKRRRTPVADDTRKAETMVPARLRMEEVREEVESDLWADDSREVMTVDKVEVVKSACLTTVAREGMREDRCLVDCLMENDVDEEVEVSMDAANLNKEVEEEAVAVKARTIPVREGVREEIADEMVARNREIVLRMAGTVAD